MKFKLLVLETKPTNCDTGNVFGQAFSDHFTSASKRFHRPLKNSPFKYSATVFVKNRALWRNLTDGCLAFLVSRSGCNMAHSWYTFLSNRNVHKPVTVLLMDAEDFKKWTKGEFVTSKQPRLLICSLHCNAWAVEERQADQNTELLFRWPRGNMKDAYKTLVKLWVLSGWALGSVEVLIMKV